jgi:hypothetical protein
MNAPMSSWRLIRAGVGREVVVTADFAATGRPEAGFADLAPHLRTDHPIWEISPPRLDTPATWSGAAMVRQWVSELDEAGMHVSAVLGFCASSSFALAIARVVGSGQPYAPQVILFDPVQVTGSTLLTYGFGHAVDLLGTVMRPDELAASHRLGRRIVREHHDLEVISAELARAYERASEIAFTRLGMPARNASELVAWVAGYLRYLVAAAEVHCVNHGSPTTVVRSADLPGTMILPAREIQSQVTHNEVLRDSSTGETITALLGSA